MEYNKSDVISVEFLLENCEYMVIPSPCFQYFKLKQYNDTDEYELECKIRKQDDINYYDFGTNIYSPIQRLNNFNDITKCNLLLNDKREVGCDLVWNDMFGNENKYQSSKIESFKEIEIKIKVDNYNEFMREKQRVSMYNILDNFSDLENCNECWNKNLCENLKIENNIDVCKVLNLMM